MADLTFTLSLPSAVLEPRYMNECRDRAWESVKYAGPKERGNWPTKDKVRCVFKVYTDDPEANTYIKLKPILGAIGGVLWQEKLSQPLFIIEQYALDGKGKRIVVEVTRRKLLEAGCARHYEW